MPQAGHNGQHFEKVRERRGVLIWMRSIRVKEAAAVCSEILDDLQLSYRTLRYHLLRTFDRSNDRVVVEVHRSPLPDQQHGADQCSGQQYPQQGACEINPKVPERVGELSCEPTDKGNAHG